MKKKHREREASLNNKAVLDKAQGNTRYRKTYKWIAALSVALITFLVYLPALKNGFVNWDDNLYVYENPNIRSLDFNFLKWSFTSQVASLWHPLTLFSLAIDYSVWGPSPRGFHFTNLVFHALNTFLVLILVIELLAHSVPGKQEYNNKNLIVGITTALLFGIHTLHVESVAWISERKDVLSAFFYLLTLIVYLKYTKSSASKRSVFYSACLILFMLALLSKPMAVSLPLVLFILDFYPLKRIRTGLGKAEMKSVLLEKLPFIAFSTFSALTAIWAHGRGGGMQTLESLPFLVRVFTAIRAYMFYLYKMILPLNLSPLYPYPIQIDAFIFEYLISLLLFIAVTVAFIWSLKRGNKLHLSLWLYYIVTLIPVIGIVQVGSQTAADRYTYLPSLGPFFLAGLGIGLLFDRYPKKQLHISFVCALAIVPFIGKTISQIGVWYDSVALWSHEIKIFPTVSAAYYNRGLAYQETGNLQQAIEDFSVAININPASGSAYTNRGAVYNSIGRYTEAIADSNKAIEINPRTAKAYNNRGVAYYNLGNHEAAIRDFTKAVEFNSKYADAYNNLGNAFSGLGDYQNAISAINKALAFSPENAQYYSNRGSIHFEFDNYQEAISDFEKATQINPRLAGAFYNLGLSHSKLGNQEQAKINYQKASKVGLRQAQEILTKEH